MASSASRVSLHCTRATVLLPGHGPPYFTLRLDPGADRRHLQHLVRPLGDRQLRIEQLERRRHQVGVGQRRQVAELAQGGGVHAQPLTSAIARLGATPGSQASSALRRFLGLVRSL